VDSRKRDTSGIWRAVVIKFFLGKKQEKKFYPEEIPEKTLQKKKFLESWV